MFAHRYFGSRYFAPTYFAPHVGDVIPFVPRRLRSGAIFDKRTALSATFSTQLVTGAIYDKRYPTTLVSDGDN